MIPFPNIDPVLVSIGPVTVRWYGVMFLAAFAGVWFLARCRAAAAVSTWSREDVDELVFQGAIGAILGGRIGWTVLHGLEYELSDPLRILRIWEGGMSLRGGMLGVALALVRFARPRHLAVADVFDFAAPLPCVGMFAVGVANFINGELWGKATDVPWAVVFHGVPRHPAQLYEAFLEGIVLGTVLWVFTSRPRPRMAPSGLFLVGYGAIRFAVEFVRMPEANRDYLSFGWVTEGQLLSLPVILLGGVLMVVAYQRRQPSGNARSWAEADTGRARGAG
jgi:phosphatidylglycerol---prolipoprotein diacylglyceryl transferase